MILIQKTASRFHDIRVGEHAKLTPCKILESFSFTIVRIWPNRKRTTTAGTVTCQDIFWGMMERAKGIEPS